MGRLQGQVNEREPSPGQQGRRWAPPAPATVLILVTLAALALRLAGIWFGWPLVLHSDESRIVARSVRILETLDFNPHFFTYPSLYIYFLSGVFAITGALMWPLHLAGLAPDLFTLYREQPAVFHLPARFINAVFGAATVPLLCAAALNLFGAGPSGNTGWTPARMTALGAAAALAVNPLHVQESHYATTDVPAVFLATASFAFAAEALHRGRLCDFLLAGALAGLAAGAKYPAGLIVAAVPIAALGHWWLRDRRDFPWVGTLGAPLVFLDAFFMSTPFAALDPRAFFDDLIMESIATRNGTLGGSSDNPFFYLLPPDPLVGTGLLGLAAAAGGTVLMARRRPEALLLVLAGFLPGLLALNGSFIKIDRYVLPAVPYLSLLIGYFAAAILRPNVSLRAAQATGGRQIPGMTSGLGLSLRAAGGGGGTPGGRRGNLGAGPAEVEARPSPSMLLEESPEPRPSSSDENARTARAWFPLPLGEGKGEGPLHVAIFMPGAAPALAAAILLVALLAQPALRSAACSTSHLLPDPRFEAARWMGEHLPPGAGVALPAYGWVSPALDGTRLRIIPLDLLYDDRLRVRLLWEQRVGADPLLGPVARAALGSRFHTPEMAARRLPDAPSLDTAPLPSLQQLGTAGASYVALSSTLVEGFNNPDTARFHPAYTARWRAFLEELDRTGRLVREWPSPGLGCGSFLKSPAIRLYELPR